MSGILNLTLLYQIITPTSIVQTYASHERILIAKVRGYDYREACGAADALLSYAVAVDIPSAVRLMKRTVPEFKSRNSPYEQYDLRPGQEQVSAQQTA